MAIIEQTISQNIRFETGRINDFPTGSLVSDCGEIEVGGTAIKVMMSAPGRYELWHPSGLQMRINIRENFTALAQILETQVKVGAA